VVRAAQKRGVLGLTRRGRLVAFMVSRDTMESLLETMELQKNRELMALVRRDKAGQVVFRPLPDEEPS
jgi:hypothetical protein